MFFVSLFIVTPDTLLVFIISVMNHRPSSAGSTSPRSCDWSHESDSHSSPTQLSPYHTPTAHHPQLIYNQPTSPPLIRIPPKLTPPELPAKQDKGARVYESSHVCRAPPTQGEITEGSHVIVDGERGIVKWIGYECSKPNRYFAGVKMVSNIAISLVLR